MIDSNLYDHICEVSKYGDLRKVHYVQLQGVSGGRGSLVERQGSGVQYTVNISPIYMNILFKNTRQKHEQYIISQQQFFLSEITKLDERFYDDCFNMFFKIVKIFFFKINELDQNVANSLSTFNLTILSHVYVNFTPQTQDVNWTYLRRSEDVQDIS